MPKSVRRPASAALPRRGRAARSVRPPAVSTAVAEVPSGLGARLRAARIAKGIGLRELSRRAEISPSMISQLENDLCGTSIQTLYALAAAIGVPVNQILAGPPAARRNVAARVRKTERARLPVAPGIDWYRLTQDPDPAVDFLYVEYAPGSASAPANETVRHGGTEYGYLLQGRLSVTVGDETLELRPGDSVTFDSTMPHRLHNPGTTTAGAIWFVLGRTRRTG